MDKKAMYQISYGLYILSARAEGRDNACIVNTVAQITSSPNRVLLGVNKANFTHDMIAQTGLFNLSVLTVDTPFETVQRFGFQSGRDVDKFAGLAGAYRAENGLYFLPEYANAYICGKVVTATDMGSHTLFLADVTDCESLGGGGESATYAYYQSHIKPAPAPTAKKGWRCKVCGYVYEGEELPADFICPLCKHGAQDFERI